MYQLQFMPGAQICLRSVYFPSPASLLVTPIIIVLSGFFFFFGGLYVSYLPLEHEKRPVGKNGTDYKRY